MVMELLYVTLMKYVHLTFKDDGNFNIHVYRYMYDSYNYFFKHDRKKKDLILYCVVDRSFINSQGTLQQDNKP